MKNKITLLTLSVVCLITFSLNAQTQEDGSHSAEDLAKKLANPVAELISVPLQNNFNFNFGPLDGFNYTLNIEPVIPISLNEKWALYSRTIIPIISLNDVTGPGNNETGLGDIVQSLFLSPKEVKNGIVWGIGPVFLLPTATDDVLGLKKWGAGPNAVVLKMQGQWTYGALVNHVWSYAGEGREVPPGRDADVSASFFQPFITYATKTGFSVTIDAENTQDWNNDEFGGFTALKFQKIVKFGKQMMQLGGGPKIFYGNSPFIGDWGLQATVILLFPE